MVAHSPTVYHPRDTHRARAMPPHVHHTATTRPPHAHTHHGHAHPRTKARTVVPAGNRDVRASCSAPNKSSSMTAKPQPQPHPPACCHYRYAPTAASTQPWSLRPNQRAPETLAPRQAWARRPPYDRTHPAHALWWGALAPPLLARPPQNHEAQSRRVSSTTAWCAGLRLPTCHVCHHGEPGSSKLRINSVIPRVSKARRNDDLGEQSAGRGGARPYPHTPRGGVL